MTAHDPVAPLDSLEIIQRREEDEGGRESRTALKEECRESERADSRNEWLSECL